jgi:SAM-dependent methyltransferase
MRKEDHDLMHMLESNFWWFVGMRQIKGALLSRHLSCAPQDILDVGCGTGINLLWMAQQFRPRRVIGCDYSRNALEWCRETLKAAPSYSQKVTPHLSRGDIRHLPFANNTFDLVINLDVLDTFAGGEDEQGLAELLRVLRTSGVAFVRAPAYQWLLSSHDILFETKHRYMTSELAAKMSRVGFQIVRTTYANSFLFPVAMAERLLRKLAGWSSDKTDAQPWPRSLEWLNGPFTACLRLEAYCLARGFTLPFGLSAICIGRKPD